NEPKMFDTFSNTFNYCTYGMIFAFIYPNKKNLMKRLFLFLSILMFDLYCLISFIGSVYSYIIRVDILNLTRHMAVGIIVGLYIFKSLYCIINTDEFDIILNTISYDLLEANELDDGAKKLCEIFVKKAKFGEFIWILSPMALGSVFPLYAGGSMIYENIWKAYPHREMVHEMEMAFVKDTQYDSPTFEIIFFLSLYCIIFMYPSFCGMDGSFCIVTVHLCFKLKFVGYLVRRAFEDANDRLELHTKLNRAITYHQKALAFYNNVQDFYGPWLFAIFIVSCIGISFNVYQIYVLRQFHLRYILFVITSVLHIYIPCVYASNVTQCNEVLAIELYDAPWERRQDISATKSLVVMIANAQRPLIFSGCGLVDYNMQLFVTAMKTTYSFYTLMTST
ncbi:odorant receptor Or2-like, partial [Galleria mellonella]|uniref:Odorant receptor n=1 Tax=Galleria mellonella TaxID=7137 RepID=A0ABM3M8P8_GALME